MALDDMDSHFAWQAWHLSTHGSSLCVAGVALGDIHLRFTSQAWYLVTSTSTLAWQAWHLWHWAGSGGALGFRRGAGDAAAVGVKAVALGDIHLRFTWQAWYLLTSTSTLVWQAWHLWHWAGSGGALGFRRGAGDAVAGVALGDIHLRFTWQAWYLVTSTSTLPWQAWHLWHLWH